MRIDVVDGDAVRASSWASLAGISRSMMRWKMVFMGEQKPRRHREHRD